MTTRTLFHLLYRINRAQGVSPWRAAWIAYKDAVKPAAF